MNILSHRSRDRLLNGNLRRPSSVPKTWFLIRALSAFEQWAWRFGGPLSRGEFTFSVKPFFSALHRSLDSRGKLLWFVHQFRGKVGCGGKFKAQREQCTLPVDFSNLYLPKMKESIFLVSRCLRNNLDGNSWGLYSFKSRTPRHLQATSGGSPVSFVAWCGLCLTMARCTVVLGNRSPSCVAKNTLFLLRSRRRKPGMPPMPEWLVSDTQHWHSLKTARVRTCVCFS